jgi:hypothetical protein
VSVCLWSVTGKKIPGHVQFDAVVGQDVVVVPAQLFAPLALGGETLFIIVSQATHTIDQVEELQVVNFEPNK